MRPGTDLRLVPAALAAWAAAWWAVGMSAAGAVVLAAALAGPGVALLLLASVPRRVPGSGAGRAGGGRDAVAFTVALALVAGAVTAAGAAARSHAWAPWEGWAADGATVELIGRVTGEPVPVSRSGDAAGDRPTGTVRLRVRAQTAGTPGGRTADGGSAELQVVARLGDAEPVRGARVRVTGRLGPARPGDRAVAVLRGQGPVELVEGATGAAARVADLRAGLLDATDRLPPDARGLVPGTAVGETRRMPPDLVQAMRDTSLTHVTAVSGAHVAVVSLGVLGILSLLRVPRGVRAGVTAAALIGFVVLVHPAPSVLRAGLMGAVQVLALLLRRPSRAVPALAAAVVLLLVVEPWYARTYGFVLSVVATAAIVLLAPALAARLARAMPYRLAQVLAVPVAAQAACGPVLVLIDPVIPLYAVPANVLATPALLPATLGGVTATVVAGVLPAAAGPLVEVAGLSVGWIAAVARTASAMPGARLPWAEGPGGAAVLAGATAVLLGLVLRGVAPARDP